MSQDITISDGHTLSLVQRLRYFTPMVAALTIYLSLAALNFGYDVGTFSGVQAMQPFAKRFGEYNPTTKLYALPPYLSSIMNSTPFLGKLIGALSCGHVAERWGRKTAVGTLACISLVGVTLQTSATTATQFTIGRIINFGMTGFTIVVVPIFMGECAPLALRGLISGSLQFQIGLGQLISSCVNLKTQTWTTDAAWQIPIGIQFVVPIFILACLPLMPESPRWLLSKERKEEAVKSLQRLRGKTATSEMINAEIELLSQFDSNAGKGPWSEVFNAKNRKRTTVAVLAMFFQQITGQAFPSQYGIIFYQRQGISNAFLWGVIGNVVGLVAVIFTSLMVDGFGRRPMLFTGGSLMAFFLFLLAGVGSKLNPSDGDKNVVVASVILFGASFSLSWAPIAYITLSEAAASRVKEKTNNLAASVSILTTFIVSFTLPYLLNAPYANLGANVGWIYGSICVVALIVTFFCIPEMKGRSLEEVDALFESGVPMWRFRSAVVRSRDLLEGKGVEAGVGKEERVEKA